LPSLTLESVPPISYNACHPHTILLALHDLFLALFML
jgi:hypothetical protein